MAYTLSMVYERNLKQEFDSRDCGGYFEHVWGIHPLADIPENRLLDYDGFKLKQVAFSANQTVIEGSSAYYSWLKFFYPLNFFVSQLRFAIFLVKLVRREGITHIMSTDPYFSGLMGLFVKMFSKAKLIIWVIANYDEIYKGTGIIAMPKLFKKRWIEKIVEKIVFKSADLVAGGNQNNLEYALCNGASAKKATVFPVGKLIHPNHLLEVSERPLGELVKKIAGVKYFIYVGRINPLKYLDDVIKAFNVIDQERGNCQLIMAGDGPMKAKLEQMTEEMGISQKVHFVGNIDQESLASLLGGCFALMSPVAGRSLIEATLAGLPVIAYDLDWQPEFLGRHNAGIIVPSRDWNKMAEAAIHLIDHPAEVARMSQAARQTGIEAADTKKLFEHEQQEFEKLLAGNK